MRVALALQERKDEVVSAIYSDEFGESKPHCHIEIASGLQIRRQNLKMVEPVRRAGPELVECDDQPRLNIHSRTKLDR